jgi:hypothetical protein
MLNTIIDDILNYPIQPQHINSNQVFWNSFGNLEKETSARWIVKYCQKQGNWKPFTYQQIEEFYNLGGYKNFWFNGIAGVKDSPNSFLIIDGTTYYITHQFIAKCFLSSPNLEVREAKNG